MVARGLTAEDIALKLDIVARTVRFHVDSARTKMGALNREEAIALVAKAGLINICLSLTQTMSAGYVSVKSHLDPDAVEGLASHRCYDSCR